MSYDESGDLENYVRNLMLGTIFKNMKCHVWSRGEKRYKSSVLAKIMYFTLFFSFKQVTDPPP